MTAKISQTQAFEALLELFDPDWEWWWTLAGLILLTDLARTAAGLTVKGRGLIHPYPKVTGDELRYWLAVYSGLRAMFPAPKGILGHARAAGGGLRAHPTRKTKG